MPKLRADQLLYSQGLAESRERAKRLIMAGQVWRLDHEQKIPIEKPGSQFPEDTQLMLKQEERFVSRGGYKLLTAIEEFDINIAGTICLDAGASTGGFTDCLLQFGAAKVYAVDVGRAQLHEKMRNNAQVVNLEGINLRHAQPTLIPELVDVVVADVSFISLTKILPPCVQFMQKNGQFIVLIKPQFELDPQDNIKGVVRDKTLQQKAVHKIITFCETELNLQNIGLVPSKIKGPKGNQEYLAWFKRKQEG